MLKYKLVLLSNPTNAKISVDGMATLYGDQVEISKQLSPDEKNIPIILNLIYQEIFPLFFIMSKSMHIPCPAYRLSQMSYASQTEKIVSVSAQEPSTTNVVEFSAQEELSEQVEITPSLDQKQIIEQQM